MTDPQFELLMWARGPGFDIALAVFVFGITMRVIEILLTGRKTDIAPAKGSALGGGLRTILTRSLPRRGLVSYAPVTYFGGYLFHVGFFVCLLFFGPHIKLLDAVLGVSQWWPATLSFHWPDFGRVIIETSAALSMLALLALLFTRIFEPVRHMLTTFDDYLVWLLTFLPLLTGYIAVNKFFGNGTLWIAIHILSVEALMVVFPFTKLMHAVTFLMSRYYNGALQGRKGAQT